MKHAGVQHKAMSRRPYFGLVTFLGLACVLWLMFRWLQVSPSAELAKVSSSVGGLDTDGVVEEQLRGELKGVRESLRNLRSLLEDIACESKGVGARGGFCLKPDQINVGYNYMWDLKLCGHLEAGIFKDQDVADFGAGLGWYGMYWTRRTKPSFRFGKEDEWKYFFNSTEVMNLMRTPMMVRSWKGYDGAGNVELVTNGLVKYLDLSEEQDLGIKFDWVFSLEVGEHIPQAFETIFIENLIRHACKGVVLSWAVIGQGGHFHVNNHDNDYIKDLFKTYGFENMLDEETRLRSDLSLGHLVRTLMVFKRIKKVDHPNCPKH